MPLAHFGAEVHVRTGATSIAVIVRVTPDWLAVWREMAHTVLLLTALHAMAVVVIAGLSGWFVSSSQYSMLAAALPQSERWSLAETVLQCSGNFQSPPRWSVWR